MYMTTQRNCDIGVVHGRSVVCAWTAVFQDSTAKRCDVKSQRASRKNGGNPTGCEESGEICAKVRAIDNAPEQKRKSSKELCTVENVAPTRYWRSCRLVSSVT